MKRKHTYKLALSLLVTGLFCSVFSYPASFASHELVAQVPDQQNPGLLTPRPGDQVLPKDQKDEEKGIPTEEKSPPKVEIEVQKQPGVVQIETPTFTARQIEVEGVTIFSDDEVRQVTQAYEGKEVTLEDLQKIVEALNTLYRSKGYLTTQAYVPPQEVSGGVVKIKVVEGRVGKFCVSGNKYHRTGIVARSVDVESGEVLNIRDLEKNLNASNRFNAFQVKANLSPGAQTGETDIRIDTSERQPWQLSPTFDNQGRPFIGFYRGGVELTNQSLLGYGDRFSARYIGADGTNVALGSYFLPLNGRGDEIGISYGYSHVDVDLGIPGQPDIDGRAHNASVMFIHPFDRERVWTGDISLNARRIVSETDDVRGSLDEIRSVAVGLNFNKFDRLGRTFARVETSVGMDVFGGNAKFWKANGYLTRFFRLPWNNIFMIRAFGQYTPDALPSAEAIQVGGAYSVRGFTEGLIIGDRGYNVTLEDRWPIPFLGHVSPWLAERLQGAVFYDIGQAWFDKSNPSFINHSTERTLLMGAGVGLRARLTQYLQGFIDFGFGLVDRNRIEPAGISEPTARIHFGVRSDILPEVYRTRGTTVDCIEPPARQAREPEQPEKMLSPGTNIQTDPVQRSTVDEESISQDIAQAELKKLPQIAPSQSGVLASRRKSGEISGRIGVMSILNSH